MPDRRSFIRVSAAALLSPSLAGLVARSRGMAQAAERVVRRAGPGQGGYGELVEAGPELALPEGFHYTVLSSIGRPMSDGTPTPCAFDGMAAFAMPGGRIRLVRNHENRDPAAGATLKGDPASAYDRLAGGGCTTLEITLGAGGEPRVVRDFVSLNGTIVNCAGGPTPWGSWLSGEESVAGRSVGWSENHGYVFEVPATGDAEVRAVPLKAMGRFVHEAVAVDPRSGVVYETEDQQNAGFYRFTPRRRGRLAEGGRLEMLAVRGQPNYDTARGQQLGRELPVSWVSIPDPDPAGDDIPAGAVFDQGWSRGGARFARLEGCWYGDNSVYFLSTSGGDARRGQVWRYRPGRDGGRLWLVFESPGSDVLDGPDNVCTSPRGGVVICEDGGGEQYLRGLTPGGAIFDLARNTLNTTEFCGACFSPDGRILFVNIQGAVTDRGTAQGRTLAIRGPWERGAL